MIGGKARSGGIVGYLDRVTCVDRGFQQRQQKQSPSIVSLYLRSSLDLMSLCSNDCRDDSDCDRDVLQLRTAPFRK